MSFIVAGCIVGIVISAFMVLKTSKEEQNIEKEWIEQEGQKYIDRMHEEKDGKVFYLEEMLLFIKHVIISVGV